MVFCAAGWSPLRSAACKRSHESPHSSPLCFLRLRLVGLASTRSLHCQVPVGSTAPLLVDRSQDRVLPAPHGVLTLTRRAHTWRTRSSTCRTATAPTSSPPEAQARSHRSSVRRASLSVPQQEGALGLPPVPALARSTTSTRSVSARQAGRHVPRQYIRRQCPVRVFFCVKFWAQCVTLL